jgi:hypothetical protein
VTNVYGRVAGAWVAGAGTPDNPPPDEQAQWAGHVPSRILWGYCVANAPDAILTYPTALGYSGTLYTRRRFSSGWITASTINSYLNDIEGDGQYPWISFKVPNNNWAGVINGQYDSDLDIVIERAQARAGQWMLTVHHEPNGDGNMTTWCNMQKYLSNYLAEVTDKVCLSAIANGFWFGPRWYNRTDPVAGRSAILSTDLIGTLNANHHMLACDPYDPAYNPATVTDAAMDADDRATTRLQGFINFGRQYGATSLGVGEWSGATPLECKRFWNVCAANVDIMHIALLFNSAANSSANWMIVPDSFDAGPGNEEFDGTPLTEGRLNHWKTARDNSASTNPALIP